MHDVRSMGAIEGVGDLAAVQENLLDGEGPLVEAIAERLSLQVLHHDEGEAFGLADVEERADVRVAQGRDRPCLALEALTAEGILGGV